MKKRHVTGYNIMHCLYTRDENNYKTGCGFRAAGYNKHWHYCPYCRLPIIDVSRENKFKQIEEK